MTSPTDSLTFAGIGFTQHLIGTIKKYTDADLRLYIAQIDKAKESFCERADQEIELLQAILAGEEQDDAQA